MLQEELIQPIVDIPESELKLRREKIIRGFEAEDCRAMVFFSAKSVFYLTGCQFQFTERACALILQEDGSMQMMLPKVEYTFAQKVARGVSDYLVYDEYPGEIHPMRRFSDYLIRLGLGTGRIAAESDGYPMIWGYRGPKLSSLNSALQLVFLPTLVEDAQLIKTEFDLAVFREISKWSSIAHALLRKYSVPGSFEFDITSRVNYEATKQMHAGLGTISVRWKQPLVRTTFNGQIGKDSFDPHGLSVVKPIRAGDHIISSAHADLFNYWTEMERTIFVGEPSAEQLKWYQHTLNVYQIGLSMLKPGNTCASVDRAVKQYYREENLMPYWKHHTGHGVGPSTFFAHERPFLDEYENVVLEPNMCFSCEPGFYVPGVGGFRVSNTIRITEDGNECITHFPTDVESLITGV